MMNVLIKGFYSLTSTSAKVASLWIAPGSWSPVVTKTLGLPCEAMLPNLNKMLSDGKSLLVKEGARVDIRLHKVLVNFEPVVRKRYVTVEFQALTVSKINVIHR